MTLGPLTIDGDGLKCSFEASWCKGRATLAGGLDAHHEWPKSMGGAELASDTQHLLNLCPTHHRRQHALIRAMVEHGTTAIRPVRRYSKVEVDAAVYAYTRWVGAGKPHVEGWTCNAAAVRR